ncbi:uncharacterized protein LOC113320804 isoform X2 [Papaver somniferum]|uniref:uncharacterized protein LOC113320804 isoform X2 n=1 Tax=Papaver somniferum TaxID=3469 RepID=UPI000E7004DA|nr:uncharacterized protein LOC113320804 isoform X2 [Papaver somniferum]
MEKMAAGKELPPPEKSLMMIPPDEERCCRTNGVGWRCNKSMMNLGVSNDDDGLDTKYCENHYNSFKEQHNKNQQQQKHKKKKLMRKSSSEDADDDSSSGTETWDSTFLDWKKVKYHRKGIQPPPTTNDTTSDIEGGSANVGTRRKTLEGKESSGKLDLTDFLIEKPSNKMDKDKEMKLPPDEQRCCLKANNGRYRCKNFRMGHGAADDDSVLKSKHCEQHYNYYANYSQMLKKKRSGNGEASLIPSNKMKLPPDEQRCRHTNGARCRCKNFKMSHGAADNDASAPKTKYCEKHDNYYAEHYKNLKKKRNVEGDGAAGPIRRKRKIVERSEGFEEPEPVVEFESIENYKSKCFELSSELEKKKVECIKLQGELADVKTRKNAAKDDETEWAPEDATGYWRKMFLGLENRVLRIENENSTMRCVESRVSDLERLVRRNGKGDSKLRCVELFNSEDIESEAPSLQNDVTQSGEKQCDKNYMSKPNAETSRGGNNDSHVSQLKTEEKVLKNVYDIGTNNQNKLESEFPQYTSVNISSGSRNLSSGGENVKEGKGRGCGVETPSQANSEMSRSPFVKLVSDSGGESFEEDSDSSDSESSLGDLIDMIAMKCRKMKNDREIKWKFQAGMLSSFEEDLELCMKAVCALHRQQISEDAKGLFHYSDALRLG